MNRALFQAISKRKSTRDFNNSPIASSLISEVEDFSRHIPTLTGHKTGIQVFKNSGEILTSSLLSPLGSFISNAPYFAAIYAKDLPEAQVEAGFQSEYLVLHLTELHLASCYIGGFLNFTYLEKKLKIPSGEKLLVIIPFGQLSNTFMGFLTHSMIETSKFMLGESGRKPLNELIYYNFWGKGADEYLKTNPALLQIFDHTRLAPSGANLQPWRFLITDDSIYAFSVDTVKGKLVSNETFWGKDFRNFDLGIALSHFSIAAAELKFAGVWELGSNISPDNLRHLKIPSCAKFIAQWKRPS